MPTLRPFRDYNEKDVLNLYTFSGTPFVDPVYQVTAYKGTFVQITGDGFRVDNEPTEMIGSYGNFSINNFVAQRYGATSKVATFQNPNGNVAPLGMTLFDMRELDENLIPLKYSPRKAAEMESVISGQVVPIVRRGTFLYSGIRVSGGIPVVAGANAYAGFNGEIATSGNYKIGVFLGQTGAAGSGFNGSDLSATALVWINTQ
jgi:hypothetical protein